MKKLLSICIAFNIFILNGCSNENNHKGHNHDEVKKIAKVYESDKEYLTQIALMRGHLYVGIELYKNGFLDNAKKHMKHPKSELYSDIIPTFESKKSAGFAVELADLASAVEGEKDFAFISSKYQNLSDAMALNEDYVHDSSKLLSKRIILVSSLLTVAADEYAIGIVNKNVENKFEYQDALGFTIVAKNILKKTVTYSEEEEIKKNKVLEIIENLSNLWPSLVPTGIVDGDAKIIYDAVAKINSV
ncbi:MAG: hypothetical protein P8K73_02930 [Methylophilaceae bacterium]|jgi:hypothetical protein|nr:hypothetical protein [Methylophilaceae bacterium]